MRVGTKEGIEERAGESRAEVKDRRGRPGKSSAGLKDRQARPGEIRAEDLDRRGRSRANKG